jgi:hypothetical protein
MGNDFFLIGYRIFVKYTNTVGKRLRGLYILKSETDQKKMEYLGNLFTQYKYTTTDIVQTRKDQMLEIKSERSNFQLKINTDTLEVPLPLHSPFADWKEARRFAGPLPFTFSYNKGTKEVLIIEGLRENWIPKPIDVLEYSFSFLDTLNLKNPTLANAFQISDIPYSWKKGKVEIWKP